MRGKEALAHLKVVILNLQKRVTQLDTELKTSIQNERELRREVTQLQTYRDRIKLVVQVTDENTALKTLLEEVTQRADMWEKRAVALAIPARELPEALFSKDSLAVLADMKMLPDCITVNRTAKRNARSGAAMVRHSNAIDQAINKVQGHGITTEVKAMS